MSTGRNIVAGVIAVVTIYTTYPMVFEALRGERPRASEPASPPGVSSRSPESFASAVEPAPEIPRRGTTGFGPEPVTHPWQVKLLHAKTYGQLVRDAKPDAERGNADAQFALYGAFSFCRDGLRKRTAEQHSRIPEEVWTDMHQRCDDLASEYSDLPLEASRWLDKSFQANFPRAQAFSAYEDLKRLASESIKRSERQTRIANARSNMVQALRSNDPAITLIAADCLPVFFGDDPRVEQATWIWRLAACEQGLPCGQNDLWLRNVCLMRGDCATGEPGAQYIRRASGDFSSLLARARGLASALRNSTLDDAGFDATVTSLPVKGKSSGDSRPSARLLQ